MTDNSNTIEWRGFYHRKFRGREFEDAVPWDKLIDAMDEEES
ncbi:hypothetical protein [Halocatena halophila]